MDASYEAAAASWEQARARDCEDAGFGVNDRDTVEMCDHGIPLDSDCLDCDDEDDFL